MDNLSNQEIWEAIDKLKQIIKDGYWREVMIDFEDDDECGDDSHDIYVESLNLFYRVIFHNLHVDAKDELIDYILTDMYRDDTKFDSYQELNDMIHDLDERNKDIMKTFPCRTINAKDEDLKMDIKISIRKEEQRCKKDDIFKMHKLIKMLDNHKNIIVYLTSYISRELRCNITDAFDVRDTYDDVKRYCKTIQYLIKLLK